MQVMEVVVEVARELPPEPLTKRLIRWMGDFERAVEMQPVDHLEHRVAHLERRLAALMTAPSSPVVAVENRKLRAGER